jgi:hypothetical protein
MAYIPYHGLSIVHQRIANIVSVTTRTSRTKRITMPLLFMTW